MFYFGYSSLRYIVSVRKHPSKKTNFLPVWKGPDLYVRNYQARSVQYLVVPIEELELGDTFSRNLKYTCPPPLLTSPPQLLDWSSGIIDFLTDGIVFR